MKTKICKKALVILLMMQSCIIFSQQFGSLENVENLFKLTKIQVENTLIKNYGYHRSATDKSGIVTYSRVGERGVIYYANVFYKKDKLKSIAWEDNIHIATPIIGNIYNNSDYEIDNDKSNSSIGMFVYYSDSKKFQVAIFRTEPNVQRGKISFSLEKISTSETKKKVKDKNDNSLENDTVILLDIKRTNIERYNELVREQEENILNYFVNNNEERLERDLKIPTFQNLIDEKQYEYLFNNVYNAYYRTEDHSRPSVINQNLVIAGTYDIRRKEEYENISGSDSNCILMKQCNLYFPTLKIDGKEYMTDMRIENIKVEYLKGLFNVKIKKGQLNFLNDSPNENIKEEIKKKFLNSKDGQYLVKYKYIKINELDNIDINIENKNSKKSNIKSSILSAILR